MTPHSKSNSVVSLSKCYSKKGKLVIGYRKKEAKVAIGLFKTIIHKLTSPNFEFKLIVKLGLSLWA